MPAQLQAATQRWGQRELELRRFELLSKPRRGPPGVGMPSDGDLSRAASAPAGLKPAGSTLAALSAGMPKAVFDAWQRGELPGMPAMPGLPKLSAEKLREIEERRRARAKTKVEEWRQREREFGEAWLRNREWCAERESADRTRACMHTCTHACMHTGTSRATGRPSRTASCRRSAQGTRPGRRRAVAGA